MSLKEHKIPSGVKYAKLSDYPDEEKISVYGVGISSGGKYGDQAYLLGENNLHITLPARYVEYIRELLMDDEALTEIQDGCVVVKGSYEYGPGKITPVFEWY